MDQSVSPSQDFFNYVNGTWIKTLKFQLIELVGEVLMNCKNTDDDVMAILKEAVANKI